MGRAPDQSSPFFLKIATLHVGIWFLWPTGDIFRNGITIGSVAFAGLKVMTNRQTDHTTLSVAMDCIYLVLHCGLIILIMQMPVFMLPS